MPYIPTGTDRDSYISGIRRGNGRSALHDVNARRDNLPDNVFRYLKEQVDKERFEAYAAAERRSKNQIDASKGRRIAPPQDGISIDEATKLSEADEISIRHAKLKELYSHEMGMWESELAAKGLAIAKH
eukprot:GILI01016818.1.p1 GENE.GILI01016818.1~~GILI01016818.1.p1  ORF type:complete len:129 (-),score=29.72 GILI01016818.1:89-475(-)